MMSVNVYVLGDKGRTVATVGHATKSDNSITTKQCQVNELKSLINGSDAELFHFVPSGAVLFPDFYKAMLSYLEHSQRDYVFCPCLRIEDKTASELRPGDKEFSFGQMIIKSWVVKELGEFADLAKMSRRVIAEYRGIEIPHCLYMEM
jgi:hypothetical protein